MTTSNQQSNKVLESLWNKIGGELEIVHWRYQKDIEDPKKMRVTNPRELEVERTLHKVHLGTEEVSKGSTRRYLGRWIRKSFGDGEIQHKATMRDIVTSVTIPLLDRHPNKSFTYSELFAYVQWAIEKIAPEHRDKFKRATTAKTFDWLIGYGKIQSEKKPGIGSSGNEKPNSKHLCFVVATAKGKGISNIPKMGELRERAKAVGKLEEIKKFGRQRKEIDAFLKPFEKAKEGGPKKIEDDEFEDVEDLLEDLLKETPKKRGRRKKLDLAELAQQAEELDLAALIDDSGDDEADPDMVDLDSIIDGTYVPKPVPKETPPVSVEPPEHPTDPVLPTPEPEPEWEPHSLFSQGCVGHDVLSGNKLVDEVYFFHQRFDFVEDNKPTSRHLYFAVEVKDEKVVDVTVSERSLAHVAYEGSSSCWSIIKKRSDTLDEKLHRPFYDEEGQTFLRELPIRIALVGSPNKKSSLSRSKIKTQLFSWVTRTREQLEKLVNGYLNPGEKVASPKTLGRWSVVPVELFETTSSPGLPAEDIPCTLEDIPKIVGEGTLGQGFVDHVVAVKKRLTQQKDNVSKALEYRRKRQKETAEEIALLEQMESPIDANLAEAAQALEVIRGWGFRITGDDVDVDDPNVLSKVLH